MCLMDLMQMEIQGKLSILELILQIKKLSTVDFLKLTPFATIHIGHFKNDAGNLFVVDRKGGVRWCVLFTPRTKQVEVIYRMYNRLLHGLAFQKSLTSSSTSTILA